MSSRTVVEGHRHSPPREENKICEGLRSSCFGMSMVVLERQTIGGWHIAPRISPPLPAHVSMGGNGRRNRVWKPRTPNDLLSFLPPDVFSTWHSILTKILSVLSLIQPPREWQVEFRWRPKPLSFHVRRVFEKSFSWKSDGEKYFPSRIRRGCRRGNIGQRWKSESNRKRVVKSAVRKFNLDGYSVGTRIRRKRAIDLFLLQVMQMSNEGRDCSSISPTFRVTNRVVKKGNESS